MFMATSAWKCQASTCGSKKFQRDFGVTRVPTLGRASTSPLASMVRTASRSTVRDTPYCSIITASLASSEPTG